MTTISTKTRAIVDALMRALYNVRKAERTVPYEIKYGFGNLKVNEHDPVGYRIVWIHEGGTVLKKVNAPDVTVTTSSGDTSTVPSAGYRRANYTAKIFAPGVDKADCAMNCEQVLDQLVTASLALPFPEQVSFVDAPYKFKTEYDGKWNDSQGLLDTTVYIQSSVPAKPPGEFIEVTVQGPGQFKTAIVENLETSIDDEPADIWEIDRVDPEPITWEKPESLEWEG